MKRLHWHDVVPEWLPGSLWAGLDWRTPEALSSLPRSSGTRLKIRERRNLRLAMRYQRRKNFQRHIFALTNRRYLLPMASCGKVHPSFSAIWASSFSLACCFLPSSLTIFSLNHWYGYRSSESRCVRFTCKDRQMIIQFLYCWIFLLPLTQLIIVSWCITLLNISRSGLDLFPFCLSQLLPLILCPQLMKLY